VAQSTCCTIRTVSFINLGGLVWFWPMSTRRVRSTNLRGTQFLRQWRLLKLLESSRRGVSVDELANLTDEPQSKRTTYRDLEVLERAGFPIVNEVGRWRLLEAGEGAWTVPVSPSEVVALMLSEDLLEATSGTWMAESLGRLRNRLSAMLTPAGRAYCVELKRTQVATLFGTGRYTTKRPQIDAIHEAIEKEHVLTLSYSAPGKSREKRVVEPYCTWFAAGRMYLVGYCRKAEDIRTFAVQRIDDAIVMDEAFEPDPTFDAAAFTRKGFGVYHGPTFRVTIDFSPRVAHLIKERRYHASQRVTDRGKGVRLRMDAAGLPELAAWVAGFGGDARVVGPEELVAAVEKLHADALMVSKTRRDVTSGVTPL
jgi:predicted DNA-binding transcriptional regulator YafY